MTKDFPLSSARMIRPLSFRSSRWVIVLRIQVIVARVLHQISKSGIKTTQAVKDRVRDRFKAAKRDYDEHYRNAEKSDG